MDPQEIALQNPWRHNAAWAENDRHLAKLKEYRYTYHRDALPEGKDGAVVLYGPRQVGKTTWLKMQIAREKAPTNDILYLNAEAAKDRFDLYETVRGEIALHAPKRIFIDEIGAVADWEIAIKLLSDSGAFSGRHVILTGSSSLNILKKAERLPGRLAEGRNKFRYYPLSFREVAKVYGVEAGNVNEALARADGLGTILQKYFMHGGYIRAINEFARKGEIGEELFALYSSWIDGELAKVKKSPETATFLMDGVALALTNDSPWAALAREVSQPTARGYAETLRDMFILGNLERSRRANEGFPKNKKVYFQDPFLYWLALFRSRKIGRADFSLLDNATMGKLAELSAYAALVQCLEGMKKESDFDLRRYAHFDKGKDGEIDFAVKFGKNTEYVECKYGAIGKEKPGVVYITKDRLGRNKVPLAVFLMFPQESVQLARTLE